MSKYLQAQRLFAAIGFVIALAALGLAAVPAPAQAACPGTIPTTYGQVTQSVTPGGTGSGSYRIWARLNGAAATNAMYLQINGQCFVMGGGGIPVGSWGWVDYTDGASATKANVTLTGGATYSLTMTGREAGLKVARVIFTTNTACVPSGDGANCASDTPPSVSVSAPAPNSTVGGTAVTLAANASDDKGVASVAFRVDGVTVATDTSAPYSAAWNATTVANGSHTIAAVATDTSGQTATSSVTVNVGNSAADTTAPTAPTLSAGAVGAGVVNMSWTAANDPTVAGQSTSGVASYRISRGTAVIATVAAPSLSYSDTNVSQGTSYTYLVQAIDAAGNVGPSSNALSVKTTATTDKYAPPVPAGLRQTSVNTNSVAMSWSGVTDGADPGAPGNQVTGTAGYKVYRGVVLVATVTGAATTSFTESNLTAGAAYGYSVASFDNAGNVSSKSAVVSMTTSFTQDTTAPTTPGGLTVASKTQNSVKLTWNASTDPTVAGQTASGLAGYDVYRGGLKIAATTAQTYTDTGLAAGSAYSYYVIARDGANNWSTQSASVTVTTSQAADTTPPSVPENVLTSADTAAAVDIFWDPSTDAGSGVAGYNVYRNGAKVNAALVVENGFTDSTVDGAKTYSYTVAAVDNSGNISAKSAASEVTTPTPTDLTPPSKPAGLRVAAVTINSVTIAWNASSDNRGVFGYHVYRAGGSLPIGDVTSTSFTEEDLNPSTAYSYTVSAYDIDGNESGQSGSLVAVTKAVPAGFTKNDDGSSNLEEEPGLANNVVFDDGTDDGLDNISSELTVSLPEEAIGSNANGIVKVEYFIDGKLVATVTESPFTTKINTAKLKNGKHELKIVTTDAKGGTTESVRSLTVSNGIWSKVLAFTGEQKSRLGIAAGIFGAMLVIGIVRYYIWNARGGSGGGMPRSNLRM